MKGFVRKKNNRWYYVFDIGTVDGKRKKIERAGGKTKKEAEKALRDAIHEFEGTGNIQKQHRLTFQEYLEEWIINYVNLNCKYNTIKSYESIIRLHINPNIGLYKLSSLNPAVLQNFINSRMINGFSKNFLSNIFGVLSGSLQYAVYPMEYIRANPMQHVKVPSYSEQHKRYEKKYLTKDELQSVLNRFPEGNNFFIPIQIAIHTGMRAGEVCSLIWDDIDFENCTVNVNTTLINKGKGIFERSTPKTISSIRKIIVGKTLINILRKELIRQKENRLLFGTYYNINKFICNKDNGDQITTDSLKYLSRVVNYQLNIDFNFHAFRHGHATMLLENGANFKDIQLRLGHSKLATTMDTYSHVTEKLSNQTVSILESVIGTKNN